jgi:hypothetical protein
MRDHLPTVNKVLARQAGRLLKNAQIQGDNLSYE